VKILHITNNDYDGAGRAVIRLHRELIDIGVDSSVALAFSKYENKNVFKLGYGETKKKLIIDLVSFKTLFNYKKLVEILYFLCISISEKVLVNFFKPEFLFNLNFGISRYRKLRNHIKNFDVLIFHSIQGMIFPDEIVELYQDFNIKIIMHPLDMELITGGCHFNDSCNKWQEGCGNCFQLNSNNYDDRSNKTLISKKSSYSRIPIHWVATNSFIKNRLISSAVTSIEHKFSTIYLGVDKDRYVSINKSQARKKLELPTNKKIILFGCLNFLNERKGAEPFKNALCKYFDKDDYDNVCLVTFGETNGFSFNGIGIEWIHLGMISTNYDMNNLYRAADLLVSPSLDDLGPVIVVEAFMNELAIVSFNTGVATDIVINGINGNLVSCFDFDELGILVRKNIFSTVKRDNNKKLIEMFNQFSPHSEATLFLKKCF
jgi:glycosyltransferase involved in cell wall biosynthesis